MLPSSIQSYKSSIKEVSASSALWTVRAWEVSLPYACLFSSKVSLPLSMVVLTMIKWRCLSLSHTELSHTKSVRQTTFILIQTHGLLSFSPRHIESSHSHSVTQIPPILTQSNLILPFSLRPTEYSHSHSVTQNPFIFTHKHRLLPFSLIQTNSFDSQTTLIFTKIPRLLSFSLSHILLPFSIRYTDYPHSYSYT